jgi:hypothetical protein
MLARREAAVAHELRGPRKPRQFADFRYDRDGRHAGDAAQGLERVDDGPHRSRRGGHGLLDRTLETSDARDRMLAAG